MERKENSIEQVVGERLTAAMKSKKITRVALGDRVGITRQAIGQYMDGKSMPTADKLAKIAKELGVSSDYLLGLSDQPRVDIDAIEKDIGLSDDAIQHLKDLQKKISNDTDIKDRVCDIVTQAFINLLILAVDAERMNTDITILLSNWADEYISYNIDDEDENSNYGALAEEFIKPKLQKDIFNAVKSITESSYKSIFSKIGLPLQVLYNIGSYYTINENLKRIQMIQKQLSIGKNRILEKTDLTEEEKDFQLELLSECYSIYSKQESVLHKFQKDHDIDNTGGENDGEC